MSLRVVLVAVAAFTFHSTARADEGMWLPNQPPLTELKAKHGFQPTPAWMEHCQKSAVRFSSGGSGSLVSADGLVMTNHHVGSDVLAQLSTADRDLLKTGFAATTRDAERKCPDLELDVLWSIEDVTKLVEAATPPDLDAAAAGLARRKVIAEIAAASEKETGLKSEVVTLYHGARFHLYRYRTYRDIRLVFAPEADIAFFGGDTDNFEFPRFDLDCCFFRIYGDDGKPLTPEHHLAWSTSGAKEGELVFVWGHPGKTQRLYTAEHLAYLRDVELPMRLARLWRSEVKLAEFMGQNEENARTGQEEFFGVQNSRKARTGLLNGLQTPEIMAAKRSRDDALRARLSGDPAMLERLERGRAEVTKSLAASREVALRYDLLEGGWRGSELTKIARHIVRLAAELPKPNGERLTEYGDANLDTLKNSLYSPVPIHANFEASIIASSLGRLAEQLGGDDPLVVKLLAGKSPADRARELVKGSSLEDPNVRKALVDGGTAALADAVKRDALLAFVAAMDGEARAARSRFENEVESPQRRAYADIAAAEFAANGESVYPDATFTLRMAYGTVKGYESDGKKVKPFTDFAGLYRRAAERAGQLGFDLPPSWREAQAKVKLDTPFNFVCSADIIGGNSGSPIVNATGELVGLVFDGNIDSLLGDVYFDETSNRTVAVDSRGLLESLRSVYGAGWLVDELTRN